VRWLLSVLAIGSLGLNYQVPASQRIIDINIERQVSDSSVTPDQTTTNFQYLLEQNLASEGITVNWIENGPSTDNVLVDIRIDVASDNLYLVVVGDRMLSVSKLLSPVLFDTQTPIPLEFPFSADQSQDFLELFTGIALYSVNRCDLAVPHFEASLRYASSDTEIDNSSLWLWQSIFYHASCELLAYNYNVAVNLFERIASNWDISSTINLAWTYIQVGEEEKAFILMGDLLDNPIYLNEQNFILPRRAQLYALTYRYDDAIADLNTAIELDSDNPELYTLRGQMYLYLYEWDSALADYNHAIELDPAYADAYYYRAVLYYSILQTGVELRPEALADFQHYLELAPEGDHAPDAAHYIDQIQTEFAALNE
jgi:tetratricopeptide (TPR) repeat protein